MLDASRTGRPNRTGARRRVAGSRLSDPGLLLRRRTGISERMRAQPLEQRVPCGLLPHTAGARASGMPLMKIALVLCVALFASAGIFLGVTAYAKSREIDVRIENGPVKLAVTTTARTVRELLEQNRVRVGPNDEVMPAPNTRLSDGMIVVVNRAITVFIRSSGQMKQLYMTGGTVQDALVKAKVRFDADDEISPAPDTVLTAGVRIKHVSVERSLITELQHLKYETVYESTNTLLKGKTKIKQYGRQGVRQRTVEVIYKDGAEVSRKVVENITTQAPQDRVVLKGTGTPSKPSGNNGTGSTGSSGGTPKPPSNVWDGSGVYSEHYRNVRKEDLVVPPVPSTFRSVVYMQLTAYTHTGRRTATGNWPQFTRTLSKPGTIAVDPKAIPYGTLLYVTGYGYCVAEDTGSNKVDSSRMGDLFMNTREECMKWGRRRNVAVYVIQENYKRN